MKQYNTRATNNTRVTMKPAICVVKIKYVHNVSKIILTNTNNAGLIAINFSFSFLSNIFSLSN
jgi:hypothetical protein